MKRNRSFFPGAAPLKVWLVIFCVLVICCSVSYGQKGNSIRPQKPTVLILATYHMANPGADVMNVRSDDVLTAKRQKEIREFILVLKRFKPTKIAVEMPFGSAQLDEQYSRYLSGEYKLTSNEIDQIGFRLAKELNHPKMYGVDAGGTFDIGRVFAFAGANNQQETVDQGIAIGKRQVEEDNYLIRTATITKIYQAINDRQKINQAHRAYLLMTRIGKEKAYPGADLLGEWYKRNLKIFSNIQRVTESKNDRVLVIIGGNHVKLLQQFIIDAQDYNLETADKYL